MYDDTWLNTFVSREKPRPSSGATVAGRDSRDLKEDLQADVASIENALNGHAEEEPPIGPPKANVPARARSYTDFHRLSIEGQPDRPDIQDGSDIGAIATEAAFLEWYDGIKDDMLERSHEEYRVYRDQLKLAESHLDNLLQSANSALETLRSLSDSFKSVDQETSTFQSQCEDIVNDQKRTTQLAEQIHENLQYYAYLDPINRRLNAPGASNFVRRLEFSEMLSNLDACLEYMQAHPNHKESATFKTRYRQLLTRALTLIRNHFTNALRDISADVSKRIAAEQLNDTAMTTLLYAKFRVGAPELKRMGLEIYQRAVPTEGSTSGTEGEYQGLLNELYQSYSTSRMKILSPIIVKKMANIAATPSTEKDLIAFARSSIVFIRSLCSDEHDLWLEWFADDGGLYDYLEALCEPFFDHLRPRTIHETQIVKLCELCTLIQTQYMDMQTPDDTDEEYKEDTQSRLDFASLIQPALEDAQTRLVFLAITVLRNDIEYFKPQPEDLDYPARNLQVKSKQPALSGKRAKNGAVTSPPATEDENGHPTFMFEATANDWYPTLRKAVWLLSRIYRLVNSAVFDDLAHQIVHQTTLSLHQASQTIGKRASLTDGNLFLLKYLLLLKQQIVAFDIEFVAPPEVSFSSSLTSTFYELRERGGLINPMNWARLVAGGGYSLLVPKVVRNMLDAKAELDGHLRAVINDFTSTFSTRMVDAIAGEKAKKAGDKLDVNAATLKVREAVEQQVPFLRRKIEEYLDDLRTRETLVAAVQDQVCLAYEEFWERQVDGSRGRKGTKGKGREDQVWDPEVFGDWAAGVFGVGRMGFEDENGDDGMSMGGNDSE